MAEATRNFQVFVKPGSAVCNLGCSYCYYLGKETLFPRDGSCRMTEGVLEAYIVQHIEACTETEIHFSWHGGEPTLLGLDYFRRIVALQHQHVPAGRIIHNGIQTNGTLLDPDWCHFLARERFHVGLSLDGPRVLHDENRVTKTGKPTFAQALRGYRLLKKFHIPCDILCVVHAHNVRYPLQVYRFFKELRASYIGFLPLVESLPQAAGGVSRCSVPAADLGEFWCAIFDEWKQRDIGRVRVEMFEEAARAALDREHALCIFRKTCGDVPVLEHNGDLFSCDHYVTPVNRLGNIMGSPLTDLLESPAQRAFGRAKWDLLPQYCRRCDFLEMCNGGCPKDRILNTPDGEPGWNYLCPAYRRFFAHCRPFVSQVAALRQHQTGGSTATASIPSGVESSPKTGRNAPCPCGSGRKYKKCCGLKSG